MTDQTLTSFENAPFSKMHYKVIAGGAFGQFSDGYILGSVGIAMSLATPALQLTSWTLGIIAAASLIGLMFGSMVAGPLSDRIGRRKIFQSTMLIFAAVSILQFFVTDATQLIILRVLLGIAIGADYAVGITLVSEWTPAKSRSRSLSCMQAMWVAGYVGAYIAGYCMQGLGEDSWRWILLSCAFPSIIALYVRMGTPESPGWLMSKGRTSEAKKLVENYLGNNYTILSEMYSQSKSSKEKLFSPKWRVRAMVSGTFYACQVIPYFSLSIFLPMIFKNLGMHDPYFSGIIFNLFLFAGVAFGIWLVNKISRRSFLIYSFYICAFSLFLITVIPSPSVITVLACVSVFSFTISAASVLEYVYPPELFPTELRGAGVGFTVACSRIGAAGGAFLLPVILNNYGITAALAGCVATLIIGGIVCQRYAPETGSKK